MQQTASVRPGFEPFAEITLGQFQRAVDYLHAIRAASGEVTDTVLSILSRVKCLPERKQMTLVRLQVADLGFASPAYCGQIYTQAAAHQLDLCPSEAALALMLMRPHQFAPKRVVFGMEAILDPGARFKIKPILYVLQIERSCCGSKLTCTPGHYRDSFAPDTHFIFARP